MATKVENVQARRLNDALKAAQVRVGEDVKEMTGESKVLGEIALGMVERLSEEVGEQVQAQKDEALEESAAERAAQRAGQQAAPLVTQFHARANAWMWSERAKDAASGIAVDANSKNYALGQWLEGVNPSAFSAMTPASQAEFLESIAKRKDEVLGADGEDATLSQRLDNAAAEVKRAHEALKKEAGEAQAAARKVGESLESSFGARYQAAQDVLRGALRLQGRVDQLPRLMPSFWDVIDPSKRSQPDAPQGGDAPGDVQS